MKPRAVRAILIDVLLFLLPVLSGCGGPEETVAGVVGLTALGGHAPASEIEQIYYLGVFDPREQVPPTVYRVRVHGQASAISLMRFSSGWVKADLIDSLGTKLSHDDSGMVQVGKDPNGTSGDPNALDSDLPTGRKMVLFGPEGFREAPRDHRLVIVMGARPEAFFEAVDQSLRFASEASVQLRQDGFNQALVQELRRLRDQQDRIQDAYTRLPGTDTAGKED